MSASTFGRRRTFDSRRAFQAPGKGGKGLRFFQPGLVSEDELA
jgi:hypothetical protein